MDLLIELIVWIFKTLFGDQEKPAEMGRRPPGMPRPRRGQYNYGDEPGQPKSLEDILEEVRRQAQQGQPRPPQQRRAERAARREVPPKPPVAIPEPVRRPLLEAEPAPPPIKNMRAEISTAPASGAQAVEEGAEAVVRAAATATVARPDTLVAIQQTMTVPRRTAPVNAGTDFVNSMRSVQPDARLAMARQAIVMSVVIGPPRAFRPHRPGRGFQRA